MNRRAFALPIVVVLALVAGILAAVVLERQAFQRRIVSRQLASYQDTHFERGVREVVGQWTDTLFGQSIEKLLGEDGHALDIERPDGSVVSIYLFDGQGTALADATGLPDQDAHDAEGVAEQLADRLGARRARNLGSKFIRPVGPARVSIASAPREVLEAVASFAKSGGVGGAGGRTVGRFAESLLEARRQGELTEADLNSAFSAGDLSVEERTIARRLLVLKPELWNTVVDVYGPSRTGGGGGGELVARYGGRFLLSTTSGMPGRTSTLVSMGRFLSWEPLPIEEEGLN